MKYEITQVILRFTDHRWVIITARSADSVINFFALQSEGYKVGDALEISITRLDETKSDTSDMM